MLFGAGFWLELAELRARAWQQTWALGEQESWLDEWDAQAQHHLILREGRIVAAFRFTVHCSMDELPHRAAYGDGIEQFPLPVAFSSRLVVDPAWKGQGLSRSLDWLAANEPFNFGAMTIFATGGGTENNSFRVQVMKSYGWISLGPVVVPVDLPGAPASWPNLYVRTKNYLATG